MSTDTPMAIVPAVRHLKQIFVVIITTLPICSTAASGRQVDRIISARAHEAETAYARNRFSSLSRDYLSRFRRSPSATANDDEVRIEDVVVELPANADTGMRNLAETLKTFLASQMLVGATVGRPEVSPISKAYQIEQRFTEDLAPGSYSIDVSRERAVISGRTADELRDGVVSLIDQIGQRGAFVLKVGSQTFQRKLGLRLGTVPWLGSMRDVALMGYNAVMLKPYVDLHEISSSQTLPELAGLQNRRVLARVIATARDARRWGLRPYIQLDNRTRFPAHHAVFRAHPGTRGPLVWNGKTGHVLSSNSGLVRTYIADTIQRLFDAAPELEGVLVIVGGEGFYHCYMHPYGLPKGSTDTRLCGPKNAEEGVSDLVKTMVEAARSVKPSADVIAWLYSAHFTWSRDLDQADFMSRLQPGTAIASEVINGETVRSPDGIVKTYWDYSVGIVGPSGRALRQIGIAHNNNLRLYLQNEPELSLDFGGLPFIPSPSRWLQRSAAVANSGADGILALPYFNNFFGSAGAEIAQHAWWKGKPDARAIETGLARRMAGAAGYAELLRAWDLVSEAISLSPQIPVYFNGPTFLGPAHPLMLDVEQPVPSVFKGQLLYLVESSEAEALAFHPIVDRAPRVNPVVQIQEGGTITTETPPGNTVAAFAQRYRAMAVLLKNAVDLAQSAGQATAGQDDNLLLASELSVTQWFLHSARTAANFYEASRLRDCAVGTAIPRLDKPGRLACLDKLVELVNDEEINTRSALVTLAGDMRLDVYYLPYVALQHSRDLIKEKLHMLEREKNVYLPGLLRRIQNE